MVIDKVGRKPLLLFGSFGMLATMVIVGVLASQFQQDWASHGAAGWAAVAMIWFYIVNFAYSWGPASWTLIAEVFPLSLRAKGTSIAASANWMNNFIIALITPTMLASISWGLYIFFAGWLTLGILFVWFMVPETKGKTLEQMDQVFGYAFQAPFCETVNTVTFAKQCTSIGRKRVKKICKNSEEFRKRWACSVPSLPLALIWESQMARWRRKYLQITLRCQCKPCKASRCQKNGYSLMVVGIFVLEIYLSVRLRAL